ncbi:MAG: ABC transporter ATP-binding protein [Elainellaceae cyanobacterium]
MLHTLSQRALSFLGHRPTAPALARPAQAADPPHAATAAMVSGPAPWAIATRNLDVIFNPESQPPLQALRSVDLAVRKGHIQMVVGPSGAGKTTLLLTLSGLLTPTRGNVTLLDQPLGQLSRPRLDDFRRCHLGIMFQESNLFRALTALENVEAALFVKGWRTVEARREAKRVLAQVGLGDREDYLPRQLSGGQQQRVAVARSLAGAPDILVADEPTASLDSVSGERVMASIRQLVKQQDTTAVIATHDARILSFADDIAELLDGVLSDCSPPHDSSGLS